MPLDIALTQDILKPIDPDHRHKSAEMKFRERDIIWVQSSTPFEYKQQVDLMIEETLDFVLLERRPSPQGGTTEIVTPPKPQSAKKFTQFSKSFTSAECHFPSNCLATTITIDFAANDTGGAESVLLDFKSFEKFDRFRYTAHPSCSLTVDPLCVWCNPTQFRLRGRRIL